MVSAEPLMTGIAAAGIATPWSLFASLPLPAAAAEAGAVDRLSESLEQEAIGQNMPATQTGRFVVNIILTLTCQLG